MEFLAFIALDPWYCEHSPRYKRDACVKVSKENHRSLIAQVAFLLNNECN